jgi:hypothetical protein
MRLGRTRARRQVTRGRIGALIESSLIPRRRRGTGNFGHKRSH